MVLVDSNDRRTEFLSTVIAGLGSEADVEVLRARVEDAGRVSALREQFDLVTSRSFGAPAVTAECGAPFLAVGGLMIVSEPPDADPGSERWPSAGLAQLGLQPSTRVRFNEAFGYQVLVKSQATAGALSEASGHSDQAPTVLSHRPGLRPAHRPRLRFT